VMESMLFSPVMANSVYICNTMPFYMLVIQANPAPKSVSKMPTLPSHSRQLLSNKIYLIQAPPNILILILFLALRLGIQHTADPTTSIHARLPLFSDRNLLDRPLLPPLKLLILQLHANLEHRRCKVGASCAGLFGGHASIHVFLHAQGVEFSAGNVVGAVLGKVPHAHEVELALDDAGWALVRMAKGWTGSCSCSCRVVAYLSPLNCLPGGVIVLHSIGGPSTPSSSRMTRGLASSHGWSL
jgi:hypothetical protein